MGQSNVHGRSMAATCRHETPNNSLFSSKMSLTGWDVLLYVGREIRHQRSLSALVMTETEDKLIASAASSGLSSQPVSG